MRRTKRPGLLRPLLLLVPLAALLSDRRAGGEPCPPLSVSQLSLQVVTEDGVVVSERGPYDARVIFSSENDGTVRISATPAGGTALWTETYHETLSSRP